MSNVTLHPPAAARGKHVSIETTTTPVHHDFDDRALGEGPARAIATAVAAGIRAIGERADRGGRLFNQTGRLAAGIAAVVAGDEWGVVPPADRLSAAELGAAAVERMVARLFELVAALREPLDQPAVKDAIAATVQRLIRVGR